MRRLGLFALTLVVLVGLGLPAAQAVRTTGYADWEPLAGASNDYTTSMELPVAGFPAAAVASDSRSGSVGVQSGSSVFFGPGTPVGAKYGSSLNRPYLNLRPKADNATAPSTTTYTFATPTPPTGWAFVLGDIDADAVTISAKDASGAPVTAAELGFAGGFNLCDFGTPRPAGCSASVGDVPTWDAGTRTLTGNPGATDTFGATGWFEPTVALSTLTLSFTRRSGFPVYQTWFAAVARTISGTVTDLGLPVPCPVTGVTVRLVGPNGEDLGTTTPDATGAYSFGQRATQPGYVVSIEPPATCIALSARTQTVSTAAADATADFLVRAIIPQPVSGKVTAGGTPLAGVTVTLHSVGGPKSTTTAADGSYLFDNNPANEDYFVTIDVPDGYTGTDQLPNFDIVATPITGQDFALTADPNVSGKVTGGGSGLGGVTVTLTPTAGPPLTTVTAGDGTYRFDRVPAGTYDITIDTPAGFTPAASRNDVTVNTQDVPDQDFALVRPGALGGTVHLGTPTGEVRGGVTITVDGPGGPRTLTTDADGNYFLDGLAAGTYEIRIAVPDGFDGVGGVVRTVTITAQGEIRSGQDFVIAAETTTTPTPTPEPEPEPTEPGGGVLPDTGSPVSRPLLLLGFGLLGAGLAAVGISRRRPTRA
ncbi:hypothetical protein EFK50_19740 [Nocardioides marmoriginsengisoli]|uniref:alpha-amylase n=1 Tax=Nocardioides marmoriginsengisoli TaxID=661483 RepID=A0A3N0CAP6_9ACTN|nr:SdrD B-like domain-containing protein [Nocardioides marmoriginsengisoli]RNL60552.1 hypothetical protein EFK50_19740 [Nocardioides marmoriginsengisoli]